MKRTYGGLRRLMSILLILVLVGVICYLGLVAMVCWKETHVPPAGNYGAIIVLGAQVKPDGTPSLQLQWRLDAALTAWQNSPCYIVTCGARGSNEPEAEAYVMRDYLVAQRVPAESILTEPDSFNTRQNLDHAADILAEHGVEQVLVVTSDYHLPRALAIARDAGLDATGVGAPTKLGLRYWVKNHGREALAWGKYWVEKYLHITIGG